MTALRESDRKRPSGWQKRFIAQLRDGATVTAAAEAVGVSRQTVCDARVSDPVFAEAWDKFERDRLKAVENALYRNARNGSATAARFIAKAKAKPRWTNPFDTLREEIAREEPGTEVEAP